MDILFENVLDTFWLLIGQTMYLFGTFLNDIAYKSSTTKALIFSLEIYLMYFTYF